MAKTTLEFKDHRGQERAKRWYCEATVVFLVSDSP